MVGFEPTHVIKYDFKSSTLSVAPLRLLRVYRSKLIFINLAQVCSPTSIEFSHSVWELLELLFMS